MNPTALSPSLPHATRLFRVTPMRTLLSIFLVFAALCSWAASIQTSSFRIEVVTDPVVIPIGKANLVVTVTDASGKPVEGAEVRAIASMPGMNMGEREQPARPEGSPGVYLVPAVFSMAGLYEVTVTVNGESGVATFRTGENTSGSEGFPWGRAVLITGVVGLAAFVLWRMKLTGQRVAWNGIFNFKTAGSLLLLFGALGAAIWAVNNLRRPGAMTPIESQAMEMNTPAPEGTHTVDLVEVVSRPLGATVSYSGQAVGFVEHDVVARVSGAIVEMPVYVGDRVSKGQLVARLDTSLTDPEVAMRRAAAARAREGVGVAALEAREKAEEIEQAQAELGMARAEADEAHAMALAAQHGQTVAEADIRAAKAEAAAMGAEVSSAQADLEYQNAEFARARSLHDRGALTRDEFQRAQADHKRAQEMVRLAQERQRRSEAMLEGAEASWERARSEAGAYARKAVQAREAIRAKEAALQRARTAERAAAARISQEEAMAREADAGLRGAATLRGYSELRSETDGLVVQRLIAPGQVVMPGQALLRVAQLSPIRLQANVPAQDLTRIVVGARALVTIHGSENPPVEVRVSTVAPSVDPVSRTGVVEAIFVNTTEAVRPGQFLTLEFEVGESQDALVVPSSAVVRHASATEGVLAQEESAFVWVAEPGMNAEFTLRRQPVRLGARSGRNVAVVEGLAQGEQVVARPSALLQPGQRVVARTSDAFSSDLTVTVTERGYEPATLTVPAGKAFTITFVRQADPSCGDSLVFPTLDIEKNLPHRQPVKVEIPAQPPGEIKFACGMDMYRGKVVVR